MAPLHQAVPPNDGKGPLTNAISMESMNKCGRLGTAFADSVKEVVPFKTAQDSCVRAVHDRDKSASLQTYIYIYTEVKVGRKRRHLATDAAGILEHLERSQDLSSCEIGDRTKRKANCQAKAKPCFISVKACFFRGCCHQPLGPYHLKKFKIQ